MYAVKVNKDTSRLLQELAFAYGWTGIAGRDYVDGVHSDYLVCDKIGVLFYRWDENPAVIISLEEMIDIIKKKEFPYHIITIEGKEIKLSAESYQELKKQLT